MYKIGDKVKIKSLEWYKQNSNVYGVIVVSKSEYIFIENMQRYCGKEFIIGSITKYMSPECNELVYQLKNVGYFWHEWMFEPVRPKQQLEFDFNS
jgi:hypothetical protein